MGGLRSKIDYILKHNRFIYKCFFIIMSNFFKLLGLFIPIKKNRVLFTAHGRLYNDSPKAIYEYIINHHEYDNLELIWGVEQPDKIDIPGRAIKVQIDTLKYFMIALSSKYWVTCVNIERGLKFKKDKQIFLNTWHGTAIKSIDATDDREADDYSYIDLFCIAGDYDKKIFKKAFNVKEEHMVSTGLPRNDELYDITEFDKSDIKRKLGIPLDKKVLLYAPTWRDSSDGGNNYNIKPPIDFAKWKDKLGDQYVLLLRTHPYTNNLLGVEFDEFVRDVTSYNNVNDLLKITDCLISDYSAIIFDYAVTERPIYCFGYDYNEYKKVRGFSLDVEKEIPGGLILNEKVLLEKLLCDNYESKCLETLCFKNKYLQYGGSATEECITALLK